MLLRVDQLILCGLLLAGCHRISPYEMQPVCADGGPSADSIQVQDGSARADLSVTDGHSAVFLNQPEAIAHTKGHDLVHLGGDRFFVSWLESNPDEALPNLVRLAVVNPSEIIAGPITWTPTQETASVQAFYRADANQISLFHHAVDRTLSKFDLSEPEDLSSTVEPDHDFPQIEAWAEPTVAFSSTVAGAQGGVLAYAVQTGNSSCEIRLQRIGADGTVSATPIVLSQTEIELKYASAIDLHASLAADSTLHLAWTYGTRVYHSSIAPDGAQNTQRVGSGSTLNRLHINPKAFVLGPGVLVSWVERLTHWGSYRDLAGQAIWQARPDVPLTPDHLWTKGSMALDHALVGPRDGDVHRLAVAWTADGPWEGYPGEPFDVLRVFLRVAEVDDQGLRWVAPAQPIHPRGHEVNNTYREPRLARGETGLGVLLQGDMSGSHRLALFFIREDELP